MLKVKVIRQSELKPEYLCSVLCPLFSDICLLVSGT